MHRADIDIVKRIEMAYLENGYTPGTGNYRGEFDSNVRCGMGAIGVEDHTDAIRDAFIVGRSTLWIQSFQIGFDTFGDNRAVDPGFRMRVWMLFRSDTSSRGFRAGWCCAKRMFSKAPVEVVTVVPLAEPVTA